MTWFSVDLFEEKVLFAQVTFQYLLLVLGIWKAVIFEFGATGGAISIGMELVQ